MITWPLAGALYAERVKAGVRRLLIPEADGPVEPSAPPSFSVLIRTYQNADTVVEAVESALSQTLPLLSRSSFSTTTVRPTAR